MARRKRRKRIVTDQLTLRNFVERDFDAVALGLEQQAPPVDEFDWFAGIDALVKRERGLSRKRLFRDFLKVQEAASIYTNPGLRFQIFSRQGARLGLVYEGTQRHGAHVNRRWRNQRVYSALATDPRFQPKDAK